MCGGEEIDKRIRHSRRGSGDGMFDKVRCVKVGAPETGSRVATGKAIQREPPPGRGVGQASTSDEASVMEAEQRGLTSRDAL